MANDNEMLDLVEVASVPSPYELTDDDMQAINSLALVELTADDVFAFKLMAADNEADDRNRAPFNRQSLDDMAELFAGVTIIKDHNRKTDNQVGRVFGAYVAEDPERTTALGEAHAELVLLAYMVRTDSNEDFIAEVAGGIKREVSVGVRVDHAWCSVCGTDNAVEYCSHWPGEVYQVRRDGVTEDVECTFTLDGVNDVLEVSFVAVPSQRRAATFKSAEARDEPTEGPQEPTEQPEEPSAESDPLEAEVALAIEMAEAEAAVANATADESTN